MFANSAPTENICVVCKGFSIDSVPLCAGLPKDGSIKELEKVWQTMKSTGYSLQPVSLLVSLIHTVEEAYDLAHRWKLSNNEKRLGVFIVAHRGEAYEAGMPSKVWQDFLVDGVPSNTVLELLLYCGRGEMAVEMQQWKVPKFPVSGKDLKAMEFQPGPLMGSVLRELRDRWKESYFTLDHDELMQLAVKERERHRALGHKMAEDPTKHVSKLMLKHKIETERQT